MTEKEMLSRLKEIDKKCVSIWKYMLDEKPTKDDFITTIQKELFPLLEIENDNADTEKFSQFISRFKDDLSNSFNDPNKKISKALMECIDDVMYTLLNWEDEKDYFIDYDNTKPPIGFDDGYSFDFEPEIENPITISSNGELDAKTELAKKVFTLSKSINNKENKKPIVNDGKHLKNIINSSNGKYKPLLDEIWKTDNKFVDDFNNAVNNIADNFDKDTFKQDIFNLSQALYNPVFFEPTEEKTQEPLKEQKNSVKQEVEVEQQTSEPQQQNVAESPSVDKNQNKENHIVVSPDDDLKKLKENLNLSNDSLIHSKPKGKMFHNHFQNVDEQKTKDLLNDVKPSLGDEVVEKIKDINEIMSDYQGDRVINDTIKDVVKKNIEEIINLIEDATPNLENLINQNKEIKENNSVEKNVEPPIKTPEVNIENLQDKLAKYKSELNQLKADRDVAEPLASALWRVSALLDNPKSNKKQREKPFEKFVEYDSVIKETVLPKLEKINQDSCFFDLKSQYINAINEIKTDEDVVENDGSSLVSISNFLYEEDKKFEKAINHLDDNISKLEKQLEDLGVPLVKEINEQVQEDNLETKMDKVAEEIVTSISQLQPEEQKKTLIEIKEKFKSNPDIIEKLDNLLNLHNVTEEVLSGVEKVRKVQEALNNQEAKPEELSIDELDDIIKTLEQTEDLAKQGKSLVDDIVNNSIDKSKGNPYRTVNKLCKKDTEVKGFLSVIHNKLKKDVVAIDNLLDKRKARSVKTKNCGRKIRNLFKVVTGKGTIKRDVQEPSSLIVKELEKYRQITKELIFILETPLTQEIINETINKADKKQEVNKEAKKQSKQEKQTKQEKRPKVRLMDKIKSFIKPKETRISNEPIKDNTKEVVINDDPRTLKASELAKEVEDFTKGTTKELSFNDVYQAIIFADTSILPNDIDIHSSQKINKFCDEFPVPTTLSVKVGDKLYMINKNDDNTNVSVFDKNLNKIQNSKTSTSKDVFDTLATILKKDKKEILESKDIKIIDNIKVKEQFQEQKKQKTKQNQEIG